MSGKVAAVTGGSRSIGRANAEAFLAKGANVAFNGRDAAKGARALHELGAGDRVLYITGDARSSTDVKALTDVAVAR